MTVWIACPHCGQTHECQRAPAIARGACGHTIAGALPGTLLVCELLFGHDGMHQDGSARWQMTR